MPNPDYGAFAPRHCEKMPRGATHHRIAVLAPARHRERVRRCRSAVHQKARIAGKMPTFTYPKTRGVLQQIFRPRTRRVQHQIRPNVEFVATNVISRSYAAD